MAPNLGVTCSPYLFKTGVNGLTVRKNSQLGRNPRHVRYEVDMVRDTIGSVFLCRPLAFDLCLFGVSLLSHCGLPLHKIATSAGLDSCAAKCQLYTSIVATPFWLSRCDGHHILRTPHGKPADSAAT